MKYSRAQAKQFARAHMRGIWAAIPTPFAPGGELDETQLRRDVRYYVKGLELDGIFCGGLVGEFWSLTMDERRRLQRVVIEEAGSVPVMAHCGASAIRDAVALATHAQEYGATYVVVMNPPAQPHLPTQTQRWFATFCAEVDIGVSLFNAGESGYVLSPQTIAELAEIENIVSVKNPQPPAHLAETRRLAGGRILVFEPSEPKFLDNIIEHGEQCFMCNTAPLVLQRPGMLTMRDYARLAWAGDVEGARRLSATLEPLRAVTRKWIAPGWQRHELPLAESKALCSLLGFCTPVVRPPLAELHEARVAELRRDLEQAGAAPLRRVA